MSLTSSVPQMIILVEKEIQIGIKKEIQIIIKKRNTNWHFINII